MLSKLFEMQRELDNRIIQQHELQGVDLLPNKILALQVELGELANEWKGFKHWKVVKIVDNRKLLEEYVDCLHFILSIGNHNYKYKICLEDTHPILFGEIIHQFNYLFNKFGDFGANRTIMNYKVMWRVFMGLGEQLGFTWEQIVQAYLEKNKVNHERQDTNY